MAIYKKITYNKIVWRCQTVKVPAETMNFMTKLFQWVCSSRLIQCREYHWNSRYGSDINIIYFVCQPHIHQRNPFRCLTLVWYNGNANYSCQMRTKGNIHKKGKSVQCLRLGGLSLCEPDNYWQLPILLVTPCGSVHIHAVSECSEWGLN